MESLVSIIIPTYNRKEFLEEALESVLCQSYTNFECIVVDDNSTDGTVEMLREKYEPRDKRIRCIFLETTESEREAFHTGARARNIALQRCRGDYITYLDDDNLYFQERLGELVSLLDNTPSLDFVYHNQQIIIFHEETKEWENHITFADLCPDRKMSYDYELLQGINYIDVSSVIYRNNDRTKEMIWPTQHVGEDWEMWLKHLPNLRVLFLNKILGKYRAHPNSKISYTYCDAIRPENVNTRDWQWYTRINIKRNRYEAGLLQKPQSILHKELLPSSPQTVDIIIVNWNTAAFLERCLASIERNTIVDYNLIIVDNGSENDNSKEYLSKLEMTGLYTIVYNETNLGFSGGLNSGLARSRANYVCALNVDTEVPIGWLSLMLYTFQRNERCGIVSPLQNKVECIYSDEFSEKDLRQQSDEPRDAEISVDYVTGFCMLLSRAAIDKVGFFDERFLFGTYDDDDLCRRFVAAGYSLYICERVLLRHYYNASFEFNSLDYPNLLETNRKVYEEKWGQTMSDNVLVSIVMPTRNRLHFLPEAIDSIQNQTYSNWELIVVDDDSSDGTKELITQMANKDSRIIYFNKPLSSTLRAATSGLSSRARKLGTPLAKGEFIAYFDDDNLYYPHKIEELLRFFESRPDLDIAYSGQNVRVLLEKGGSRVLSRKTPDVDYLMGIPFDPTLLQTRNFIDTSAAMIRSRVIPLIEWRDDLAREQDWHCWKDLYKKGCTFEFCGHILGEYRSHKRGPAILCYEFFQHLSEDDQ